MLSLLIVHDFCTFGIPVEETSMQCYSDFFIPFLSPQKSIMMYGDTSRGNSKIPSSEFFYIFYFDFAAVIALIQISFTIGP